MPHPPFFAPLTAALTIFGVVGMSAHGQSVDHEAARRALELGETKPLEQILAGVRTNLSGDIVSVEIERDGRVIDYELRVLDRDGRMRRVSVDAKSGQILKIEND